MPAPAGGGRTLSRDFKGVRRHKHVAASQAFSGWVGLGVGLGIGLAIALAVHLYHRSDDADVAEALPAPATAPAPASAAATEEADVKPATGATEGPEFNFYDVLPTQGVEVPESPVDAAPVKTPLPTGGALLQAGSFKQASEAEKMVARLALHGVDAKIQRASVDDETWYRVRIGPIDDVREFEAVKSKLREAEISATPVSTIEETPLP